MKFIEENWAILIIIFIVIFYAVGQIIYSGKHFKCFERNRELCETLNGTRVSPTPFRLDSEDEYMYLCKIGDKVVDLNSGKIYSGEWVKWEK